MQNQRQSLILYTLLYIYTVSHDGVIQHRAFDTNRNSNRHQYSKQVFISTWQWWDWRFIFCHHLSLIVASGSFAPLNCACITGELWWSLVSFLTKDKEYYLILQELDAQLYVHLVNCDAVNGLYGKPRLHLTTRLSESVQSLAVLFFCECLPVSVEAFFCGICSTSTSATRFIETRRTRLKYSRHEMTVRALHCMIRLELWKNEWVSECVGFNVPLDT